MDKANDHWLTKGESMIQPANESTCEKGEASFSNLFQQGMIGRLKLRNRIVMPAMGTCMAARDGAATDKIFNHYRRRAHGGAALIVTEVTNVHYTGATPYVLDIYDDRFIEGQARLATAIRDGGALAFCQLYHPGRQTSSRFTGHPLVAPSAIAARPVGEVPQAASSAMVEELIEAYVAGAVRAAAAGFDGVEVHGAHGYLISAFLSPVANLRDDAYGGDTARRSRFALEVIRRIRQRLGPSFPVIFRISIVDGLEGGIDFDEGLAICRLVEEAGVDAISISAGCYESFDRVAPPMSSPLACNAHLAAKVRRTLKLPIVVAGRINDPAIAEKVLANGSADFVAIGRGLLADPDLPAKAQRGEADSIRRCLACNTCIDRLLAGKSLRCILNPELGLDSDLAITPAERHKRVAVVGGGPAGMRSAAILARRGHTVDLFEREAALGGKIALCAVPSWKRDFLGLRERLEAEVAASGARVRLGMTVNAAILAAEAPDVIVLACGAEPAPVVIPGLAQELAKTAEDVLLARAVAGHRVLVIGGSYTACEVALILARGGHEVTIARRGSRIGRELGTTVRWSILPELERLGVRMLAGVTYEAATEDTMTISRKGVEEVIGVDTVVLATGYRPRSEIALSSPEAEVHAIGDCVEPRTLLDALDDAARLAMSI